MVSHLTHIDIGLTGSAGSGKDTAAQALVELGYVRVAFADQVRELALIVDPIIREDAYLGAYRLSDVVERLGWDAAKRDGTEVRRLLEAIGQGVRDVIGPAAWLNAGLAIARRHHEANRPCVFTDVRYVNEATAMPYLVRIERPGVEPIHPSDVVAAGLPVNRTITNDSTPEELRRKLLRAIREDHTWMHTP